MSFRKKTIPLDLHSLHQNSTKNALQNIAPVKRGYGGRETIMI